MGRTLTIAISQGIGLGLGLGLGMGMGILTLPALAQWSSDPAQAGASAYCETLNQGLGISQAELRANQAMAEVLSITAGPVAAELTLNNPALLDRFSYLIDSLCPNSGASPTDPEPML
jgi:hypothetical protein